MTAFRLSVLILLILIVLLQVRLWSAEGGLVELRHLHEQVAQLEQKVEQQRMENRRLRERIHALKRSPEAVEALARRELGMLRADEHFIRLIVLPSSASVRGAENPDPAKTGETPSSDPATGHGPAEDLAEGHD